MKRFLLLLFIIAIFDIASVAQYVTIEGRQFKDENGNDLYPVVCNYVVNIVNVDPLDFSTTFISPEHSWSTTNSFECNDMVTCDQQLQNDFLQLLSMGFNAIRLMGINPTHLPEGTFIVNKYNPQCNWTCPVTGFYINTLIHSLQDCLLDKRFLIEPPFTDDVSIRLFEHIAHFITLVSQTTDVNGKRLKVILVSGGGGGWYDPDIYPDAHSEYLEAFSEAFITLLPTEARSTLLAYDLDNEPQFSWDSYSLWPHSQIGHFKEDVCNNVNSWYKSIKINDPNHLITLGGHGMADIFEFDPSIMSLDFYSFHVYPFIREYEAPDYLDPMIDRIHGYFYWNQIHIPIPWVVGETGFTAQSGYSFPVLDGDLDDQYDYAAATLPLTWDCNGSGYSWWTYQNFYWNLKQRFYGILDYGNCAPVPCTSLMKPVCQAFEEFVPPQGQSMCAAPPNYYDPYQHAFYSPNTNIVTGHVQDQYYMPIPDALVQGWTRLYYDEDKDITFWNTHYTFTDVNRYFELIPYDYDPRLPEHNTIEMIKISAAACSRVYKTCSDPKIGFLTGQTDTLTRSEIPFVETFENIVVDVEIQPLGTCKIRAGREINIEQEFHAQLNSETWIYTDIPCEGLANMAKSGTMLPGDNAVEGLTNSPEIQLQFYITEPTLDVMVYPNPGTGIFTIEINEPIPSEMFTVDVFDQLTNRVHHGSATQPHFTLDLSHLARGIYFLQISTPTQSKLKKIIIL